VVPPANVAVGTVPWGLEPWVPPGSIIRIGVTATADDQAGDHLGAAAAGHAGDQPDDRVGDVDRALAAAAGRPLIVVVRDAHRYPAARDVVTRLLAARPDAVVVEMGLPVWRPSRGAYVATYGAAGASGQAAAEVLGLTGS